MDDKLNKIQQYLLSQNVANVPTDPKDFVMLMDDPEKANKIHQYLLSQNVQNVDPDFNKFSDYIGLKKKDISDEDFQLSQPLGKETSQKPLDSSTQAQSSPSVEQPIDIQAKIADKINQSPQPFNPFIQASESTRVAQNGRPLYVPTVKDYLNKTGVSSSDLGLADNFNTDRQLRPGEQEAFDAIVKRKGLEPPKPSYIWGTGAEVGSAVGSVFYDLDDAAKLLSNATGLKRGGLFKDIGDWFNSQAEQIRPMPNTELGRLVSGAVGIEPMIAEMAIAPEFKFKVLGKVAEMPRLVTQMMGKGFVNNYASTINEQNTPEGKDLVEGIKGAGGGAFDAAILLALGYAGGKLGQVVKNATASGLAGGLTNTSVNAVGFGGYDLVHQLMSGQDSINWDQVRQNAEIGGALSIPQIAEFAGTRAVGNYLTASPKAKQIAEETAINPTELRDKAFDIREQAKSEPNLQKQTSQQVAANVIDAIADIKVVKNEVKQNPKSFTDSVMESDLPKEQKDIITKNIEDDAYPYQLGEDKFQTKEELFDWLDKNGTDNIPSANEIGYLSKETQNAVQEWEKNNKSTKEGEGAEASRKIENTPGAIANTLGIEYTGQYKDENDQPISDSYKDTMTGSDFIVPLGSEMGGIVEKLNEIRKPFNIQEETKNAENNRGQNQEVNSEITPGNGQEKTGINDVRNNEQTGTPEQQKQEEVKNPSESAMENPKGEPDGVKEQIKEYKKPGELQKGWEEALPNIPKKSMGSLDDGRHVYIVNGTEMRDKVYTNWTEGGNGSAYPWMKKGDLFIEDVESPKDKVADLIHEAEEDKAMQEKGISYDEAHEKYGLPSERKYRETGEIPEYLKPIADLLLKEPAEPLQNSPQPPQVAQESTREEIVPKTTVKQGENEVNNEPPQPPNPPEGENAGNGDNQFEKSLLSRIKNAKGFSELEKGITERGLTYERIPNDATAAEVDAMIATKGLKQSETDIRNPSLNIPDRIRSMGAVQILDKYSELAKTATTDAEKLDYIKRGVDLADWIDKAGRDWGQGIQALASHKVQNILSAEMQILSAKNTIDRQRQKLLDKNKPDIDTKSQQMRTANEDVVNRVINSKEYQDLKARVTELENKLAQQKVISKDQKDYKAKIKQIQEKRKGEWDAFFKSSETSVSAIGLSSEQIEHLGNILSLYAQEGITRAEEIFDKFKREYFEKSGKELDDDKARAWIEAAQKSNEEKANKKQLRDKIDQVVKDHYTTPDNSGRSLKQKLIEDAGLKEADAKKIADKASDDFTEGLIASREKLLKMLGGNKKLLDKLLEMNKKGAWNDDEFRDAYADALGWPKLTDENIKEITRLANLVEKAPKGFQKDERIQDLLGYQTKNIKGIDYGDITNAAWYASVLSGPHTHVKKEISELFTTMGETLTTSLFHLNHPMDIPKLLHALNLGRGHGFYEGINVLRTGYNPLDKEESPGVLELLDSKNPLKYGRYVWRMFTAVQQWNAGGLREMRATELAINKARAENRSEPNKDDWGKAWDILGGTPEQKTEFEQQAKSEGLTGRDFKRRVWELMEQSRPEELTEDADRFALRGTYMGQPEGFLGMLAHKVGQMATATSGTVKIPFTNKEYTFYPMKRIVPFTKVIANLGNQMLDYYPPTSFARAALGGVGVSGMEKFQVSKGYYRKYTPEERAKEAMKGAIGLATIAGIWGLTHLKDKDGKPLVEITANGYGKNDKRNFDLKQLGWQPYSIRVGDRWFTYQHMPLALAIAPLGYFEDIQKYGKEDMPDDKFMSDVAKCYGNSMSLIFSAPYIQGLSMGFDALSAGDPSKTAKYFGKLATSMGKGVIEPKLIEQTIQTVDNLNGTPERTSSAWDAQIVRNIPYIRNEYNFLLNATGDPVKYPPVFGTTKAEHDPFWSYIINNKITLDKPDQNKPYYDDIKGVRRPMDDNEYYNFIRTSGQAIKQRINDEVIKPQLPEDEAKRVAESIKTDERKKFETELFGWGQLRSTHPEDWKVMRDNGALQNPITFTKVPVGAKEQRIGTAKGIPTPDLEEINNNAMELYRKLIIPYLSNKEKITKDKKAIVELPAGDKSVFDVVVDNLWSKAISTARKEKGASLGGENKNK